MEQSRIRLLMREAIASVKSGNKEWARECLSRVLRADPRNEEAWLWLSAVLETTAEKRYCLEKVLSLNPNNLQAQDGLRWLDRQAQIEAGAEEAKRTICPMCGEPNDPRAFRCVNCGQDLFVYCPNCGERVDIDRTACANCRLELGASSDGAAYFFHLGELYLEHGRPKEALEAWDKTLLLKPDYPRVAEVAAGAFLATHQRDLAIQSLQRAIEEAEGDEEHRRALRLRLANAYRDLGYSQEAAALYKELLQEADERREPSAALYQEVARFYHRQEEPDDARYYYELALSLEEDLHDVRMILAEFFLQDGYESRAIEEFRRLRAVAGEVGQRAAAYIEELRPPVPEEYRNRWAETIRGATRFFLAAVVLLLLAAADNLNAITLWDLGGVLVCLLGGYFVTAATVTPRNLPIFADLGKTRLARRIQAQRKPGKGPPRWWRQFMTWQQISARRIAARIRVARVRFGQWLQRTIAALGRTWNRFLQSRPVRVLRALPQKRFFRALAAFFHKPFFLRIAGFFRRILPRRTGPPLWKRIVEAVQGGGKRLLERAGQVEASEMQIYRWMAALLGVLLLVLGGGTILAPGL